MDIEDPGAVEEEAASPAISEDAPESPKSRKKEKKVKKARRPRQGPAIPPAAGAAAMGLGGVIFLVGLVYFAWAGDLLPLHSILMPVIEENTDIRPPYSSLGKDQPDLGRLMKKAQGAEEANAVEAAILYGRVLAAGPNGQATEKLEYLNATLGVRAP
jgi:hypothetical protein